MLGKNSAHDTPIRPAVQTTIARHVLISALAAAMLGCSGLTAPQPVERVVLKQLSMIFDPTGSPLPLEEAGKLFFATQGAIEAQLPVRINVLDPQIAPDNSQACVVRFAPWIDLFSLGFNIGLSATGAAQWSGEAIYPCTILLKNTVTDLDELRIIAQHELGHVLLNQEHHSEDPVSIMSGGVRLPWQYQFTAGDAARLTRSAP